VAVDVHQRQHQLRVLVAGQELRYLLQNVFTLVNALAEQLVGPFLGHQTQLADAEVHEFVHEVDVEH